MRSGAETGDAARSEQTCRSPGIGHGGTSRSSGRSYAVSFGLGRLRSESMYSIMNADWIGPPPDGLSGARRSRRMLARLRGKLQRSGTVEPLLRLTHDVVGEGGFKPSLQILMVRAHCRRRLALNPRLELAPGSAHRTNAGLCERCRCAAALTRAAVGKPWLGASFPRPTVACSGNLASARKASRAPRLAKRAAECVPRSLPLASRAPRP